MNLQERGVEAPILVVDDRVENLIAVEAVLQPLEQPLVRAFSGEEALRQVLLRDFAVILMDVQMPGMNGFEAATIIKSRERSRFTPIIFLTAISKEEEYVFEGYSTGAVDYLFKPFNPEILRSKVAVFIDLYLKNRQLQEQAELLRESELREMELLHRTRLLESEARYAQIVDSATDAIVTFGEDRRITVFNAAAEGIFGVEGQGALGREIDEFVRLPARDAPPAGGAAAHRHAAARNGAQPAPHEAVGIRVDGSEFPIEYTASSLKLNEQRQDTLIMRDISERKRAEALLLTQKESLENTMEELRTLNEELHERTDELERAMGARSRFYANMSHELRTPLNAILGYSSLLLDNVLGPLNEKQIESISRTNLAGTHLLELVNDILDLSKIEAGKLELAFEAVRFPDLIQDLFVTVAPFAEKHAVELTMEMQSEPWSMITDARRVRQIVLNLLSNAIKFGGGRPVRVDCERAADGGLRLSVIDRGIGIEPENLERIFEEFVQLDQTVTDPGTGLGLSISRRLAELLGGTLDAESVPGEGSTFRLAIPAARGADGTAIEEGAVAGGGVGR